MVSVTDVTNEECPLLRLVLRKVAIQILSLCQLLCSSIVFSFHVQLAPIKLSRYAEDLLFYIYYTNGGDILQLAAAAEL